MNEPYVKQISKETGKITNPITLDKPYHNQSPANRQDRNSDGKYIAFYHPITRAFVGKVKINGNNRANTCERGKNSRQFHSA